MKKLSEIKNFLSREDMKQIQGGGQLLSLDGTGGGGVSATCYCENGPHDIGSDCSWCGQVCNFRGGYKGVCLEWN